MVGLTEKEALELMNRGLYNKAPEKTTKSIFRIVSDNLFTYFNIINVLLFLLICLTGQYKNGLFIGVLVTNTFTGIIQEIRAKHILDKLTVINQSDATVLRDGILKKISRNNVVLGDVLFLKKGDQVCVDCRVHGCKDLFADESMLTGENVPVSKTEGALMYSGSFVSSGECYAIAETVGEACYSAIITARAKQRKKIKSQILSDVEKLVRIMSYVIIPAGILLFLSQMYLTHNTWQSNIVATVASMIGMIPNGLLLLITASFTLGIYRLFKKGGLGQEPAVMEAISEIDTICFDKTGTITVPGTNTVRDEIPELISFFYSKKIDVKIISGDKSEYVSEVAQKAGISDPGNVCDLTGLNEAETIKAATTYSVFCGAAPEQKMWIVKGVKLSGKKCAMAGDGVNDVMALKEADCGIAPMCGTDAAKGVAGIILMNSDFSVVKEAFSEGKRAVGTLASTASLYFNKTTFSLILTLFTILFSAISDTKYPFEPIQLTVISVLAVGTPSVLMTMHSKIQKRNVNFLKYVLGNAIPFGLSVSVGIISLTVFSKIGLISGVELSFASYIVNGVMSFSLLFTCAKPHNKLTLSVFSLLLCGFLSTLCFKDFLNLGIINAAGVISAAAGIVVSFFVVFFTKKLIKF